MSREQATFFCHGPVIGFFKQILSSTTGTILQKIGQKYLKIDEITGEKTGFVLQLSYNNPGKRPKYQVKLDGNRAFFIKNHLVYSKNRDFQCKNTRFDPGIEARFEPRLDPDVIGKPPLRRELICMTIVVSIIIIARRFLYTIQLQYKWITRVSPQKMFYNCIQFRTHPKGAIP